MSHRRREKTCGYTLVEALIVLMVVGILAALAIPNLVRSRINTNEKATVGHLHVLIAACQSYYKSQAPETMPPNLSALAATNPAYIDSALATGQRNGYTHNYIVTNPLGGQFHGFNITAVPIVPNITGERTFFADETGVIRLGNAQGTVVE